nr:magnesium transporter CorA family protein [Amylibacter sp.]
MIRSFILDGTRLTSLSDLPDTDRLACWFDLLNPSDQDIATLEQRLGITLPTREDMDEIEVSSRLYSDGDCEFMTAMLPSQADGHDYLLAPVTFILAHHHLITMRFHDPRAFGTFEQRAGKSGPGFKEGESAMLALLETIIDRLADILERAGRDIDTISRSIFSQTGAGALRGADMKTTLQGIGRVGDLTSNIKDSLVTLERLVVYLHPKLKSDKADRRGQIKAVTMDIKSLQDQSNFLSQKTTFLLDATLGLINIEQAAIIKIFSVVSVIFLPPTLVASIYGMNFRLMPELDWSLGYPLAIGAMVVSAILPFAYFKRRGWL